MKSYLNSYEPLVSSQYRIGRTNIKVYGIYKISAYRRKSDSREVPTGDNTSLICVSGIVGNKIHALKISLIDPDIFFEWSQPLLRSNIRLKTQDSPIALYELFKPLSGDGKWLYEYHIKNNKVLQKWGNLYRVYNRSDIQYISEIIFKPDILSSKYV